MLIRVHQIGRITFAIHNSGSLKIRIQKGFQPIAQGSLQLLPFAKIILIHCDIGNVNQMLNNITLLNSNALVPLGLKCNA